MSVSSARPDELIRYADTARRINSHLEAEAQRLSYSLAYFNATCKEYQLGVDGRLAESLSRYVRDTTERDEWVRRVGQSFRAADSALGWLQPKPGQKDRFKAAGDWKKDLDIAVGARAAGLAGIRGWLAWVNSNTRYVDVPIGWVFWREEIVIERLWETRRTRRPYPWVGNPKEWFRAATTKGFWKDFGGNLNEHWRSSRKQFGKLGLPKTFMEGTKKNKNLYGKFGTVFDVVLDGYENWEYYRGQKEAGEKIVRATVVDSALTIGLTAGLTVGGGAIGGALGAAIGGPVGAAIGVQVGRTLGGLAAGWLSDRAKKGWKDRATRSKVDDDVARIGNQVDDDVARIGNQVGSWFD